MVFTFFHFSQEKQTEADLEGGFYVILLWPIWVSLRKLITLGLAFFCHACKLLINYIKIYYLHIRNRHKVCIHIPRYIVKQLITFKYDHVIIYNRGSLFQNLYFESLALISATFASAVYNLIPAVTFILAVSCGYVLSSH